MKLLHNPRSINERAFFSRFIRLGMENLEQLLLWLPPEFYFISLLLQINYARANLKKSLFYRPYQPLSSISRLFAIFTFSKQRLIKLIIYLKLKIYWCAVLSFCLLLFTIQKEPNKLLNNLNRPIYD